MLSENGIYNFIHHVLQKIYAFESWHVVQKRPPGFKIKLGAVQKLLDLARMKMKALYSGEVLTADDMIERLEKKGKQKLVSYIT